MIIGLVVKINSIQIERATFNNDVKALNIYWGVIRKKYPKANFFIYRATDSKNEKLFYYKDNFIRYCPYCEELRIFVPDKYDNQCPICEISMYNCNVRKCNYAV